MLCHLPNMINHCEFNFTCYRTSSHAVTGLESGLQRACSSCCATAGFAFWVTIFAAPRVQCTFGNLHGSVCCYSTYRPNPPSCLLASISLVSPHPTHTAYSSKVISTSSVCTHDGMSSRFFSKYLLPYSYSSQSTLWEVKSLLISDAFTDR